MDTKWNAFIDKIYDFVMKREKILLGIVFGFIGVCLFWQVLEYSYRFDLIEYYIILGVTNLFMGIGSFFLTSGYLLKKYENWIFGQDIFYDKWKTIMRTLKRQFLLVAVPILMIACFIDHYSNRCGATVCVLVQVIVCFLTLTKIMDKKLDNIMNQIEEINQKEIEKALEIERKSLEKMSRSDQLRIDLITNVSHDLKTPVTSMVGYLELIKKEELSDVLRDYVDVISNKTEKLKEMIESLFSLAKASSGNIELHMEQFELNRMIEQCVADMRDRIEETGLSFITILTDNNTELLSDNMYFYRICQNLLENALKYSAKGTRVFIKTYADEKDVQLEIVNTANYYMDFKEEDILERFARGDKSRCTDGNGLGLAIVSSYAKALGGEFEIQIDCDQFRAFLIFPKNKK